MSPPLPTHTPCPLPPPTKLVAFSLEGLGYDLQEFRGQRTEWPWGCPLPTAAPTPRTPGRDAAGSLGKHIYPLLSSALAGWLSLLQGSDVSLRPAVRSSGDLPAVPQGASTRDTVEPGVLGTALLGAAVLVSCADYFLEGLALGSRLGQRLQALPALPPLCWYSWVLLGTWPALGTLGALAQWKLMDEEHGGHANAVVLSHQRRHLQLLRIRQQEAKWHRTSSGVGICEGSFRRQLPSSTRSPADSLAPSYLQSLRERQLGPGIQATAPHTVLDLDSDCGSTVPLTTTSGSVRT
ncbi:transmembrane protein 198 isoform X3 [Camelus dromedarius]|uniref:transmembrane protein 198 isoform X3 n=1 Tax=Camelus dromedarius TaxID=9838 RepID=UPI0031199E1F